MDDDEDEMPEILNDLLSSDMWRSRAGQLAIFSGNEERLKRWDIFGPAFRSLSCGIEPPTNVPLEGLVRIGSMLKEEGNMLFGENEYGAALELYTAGIVLYNGLLSRRNTPVDQQRASIFLSNRAFCFLKLDSFEECIEDCDEAIKYNIKNLKAHYRKSVALKHLGDMEDALAAAQLGLKYSSGNQTEVQDFNSLIKEIRCHLFPPVAVGFDWASVLTLHVNQSSESHAGESHGATAKSNNQSKKTDRCEKQGTEKS